MRSGGFRERYEDDLALLQSPAARVWLGLLVAGLVAFPLVASKYLAYVVNQAGIAVVGALGLNLLTGSTGQISLGHSAFLAIGGYTSAILIADHGLPFWLTLPLAGLAAGLAGLLIGIPSLRLRGLYLVITTMAFAFVVEHVLGRWEALTHADRGIALPPPVLGGIRFDTDHRYYWIVLVVTAAGVLYARNLARTRVGRALVAIRDRDVAAEVVGVDIRRYKVLAFFVSSFYAGVAGCLYANYLAYINPEHFGFALSIEYIAMIIVGGLGSVLGSVLGALFISLVPEALRLLGGALGSQSVLSVWLADLKALAYGLVIIGFLLFEPEGLAGRWRTIQSYWQTYPYTY